MIQLRSLFSLCFFVLVLLAIAGRASAQHATGELRLQVHDATGSAVRASGTLESQATHVRRAFTTNASGGFVASELPFGLYALQVEAPGFATLQTIVDVRSEIPRAYPITPRVAPVQASVTVSAGEATLLDPYRPSSAQFIGPDVLRDRPSARPGRSPSGTPPW